jgi:DNA-binding CsgD family transcriptional regulator
MVEGGRTQWTVLELSHQLSDLPDRAAYLTSALALLGEAFPGESAGRYSVDLPSGSTVLEAVPVEHGSNHVVERLGALLPHHPILTSLRSDPSDLRPRRISDVIAPRAWRRNPVYQEVFVPIGADQHLNVVVSPPGTTTVSGWAFNRARTDYSDSDVVLAGALQPLLAVLERLFPPQPAALDPERREEARQRAGLTPRELDVLELLAQGLTAVSIARVRRISTATVRKHLENTYAKLGHHDRLLAVERARRLGLLPPTGGGRR